MEQCEQQAAKPPAKGMRAQAQGKKIICLPPHSLQLAVPLLPAQNVPFLILPTSPTIYAMPRHNIITSYLAEICYDITGYV